MKNKIMKLLKSESIIMLLISWCVSSLFFFFYSGKSINALNNYSKISFNLLLVIFLFIFIILILLNIIIKRKKLNYILLPAMFFLYSSLTCLSAENFYYTLTIIFLWYILIKYYKQKDLLYIYEIKNKKTCIIVISIITIIFLIIGCGLTIIKYKSYQIPNFDFGIFSQIFYNMKRNLLPITTCERDMLLSHFHVHLSLILYLLLPIYYIFSNPETLLIMQIIILASSIVPIYLLCRHYNLNYQKITAIALISLFYPAVLSGTNFAFHENCFLLPLLLWVFYFFEKSNNLMLIIFSLLVLLVKEDAFIYIVFLGLYMIIGRKKYCKGIIMILISCFYFLLATSILSTYGEGIMSYRYSNFYLEGGNLFDAIRNVLVNPGFALTQVFVSSNGYTINKLLFILQIFIPLAFIPFSTRKISNLILLFPLLLINLLTVYDYQYNIDFQYTFASTAFIIYLCILCIKDITKENSHLIIISLISSILLFLTFSVSPFIKNIDYYFNNYKKFKIIDKELSNIPKDASVIATTFLIPHLSNRNEIYEIYYHEVKENEQIDYIIVDDINSNQKFINKYEELGYKITKTVYDDVDKRILLIIMQ